MKYKLAIIPEGWKVVPEEPTTKQLEDMMEAVEEYQLPSDIYNSAVKAAPPIDTPPVLRWKGEYLVIGNFKLAEIGKSSCHIYWWYLCEDAVATQGETATEQEARRAAEKALGFPDGLVVEVV